VEVAALTAFLAPFLPSLVKAGEKVVVIDNLSTGFQSALPKAAALVVGDVGNETLVAETIRTHAVTEIIHFAASIVVPDSVRNPLGCYRNNTMNTRALLDVAVKTGVSHFIFSSTAAVYGNPERVPVAEAAPLTPMSPYGNSKLMSEMMLKDVGAAHGLKYMILRYFNVAGADPMLRTGQSTVGATHLIKVAVETALGLRPQIEVFGTDYDTPDGTCIRDYIHVQDLARAHVLALGALDGGEAFRAFNLGTETGHSVREVLRAVERISGRTLPRRAGPRRAGDPPRLVASAARIRQELGFEPRLASLDAIVETTLRWRAEHPQGYAA